MTKINDNKHAKYNEHLEWNEKDRGARSTLLSSMNQLGNFAQECSEPKKTTILSRSAIYVYGCCIVAETFPIWTVDLVATDHITKDRTTFVDFRQIPVRNKRIYMANNNSVDVIGIGTCELIFVVYFRGIYFELIIMQML